VEITAPETYVGVLLPSLMADLTPQHEARVVELKAKRGQIVKRGDVIVAFDLRPEQHELAIADAQLKAARAEAAAADTAWQAARTRSARRGAAVSVAGDMLALVSGEEQAQAQYDEKTAQARSLSALARVAEHAARVEQLRLTLQQGELRAPFDGIVSASNFEPGATAHIGDIVARLVGGTGLRARIAVPEEAAATLRAKHAQLRVLGRTYVADLEQFSPEPERASRMFIAEGSVQNSETDCAGVLGCPALAGRAVQVRLF
jgi:RND family efflux transporter MFP subunit